MVLKAVLLRINGPLFNKSTYYLKVVGFHKSVGYHEAFRPQGFVTKPASLKSRMVLKAVLMRIN